MVAEAAERRRLEPEFGRALSERLTGTRAPDLAFTARTGDC
ncbi:hypothetical protein ACFWVU_00115 [Streptomyces sp. NPDC058686]